MAGRGKDKKKRSAVSSNNKAIWFEKKQNELAQAYVDFKKIVNDFFATERRKKYVAAYEDYNSLKAFDDQYWKKKPTVTLRKIRWKILKKDLRAAIEESKKYCLPFSIEWRRVNVEKLLKQSA